MENDNLFLIESEIIESIKDLLFKFKNKKMKSAISFKVNYEFSGINTNDTEIEILIYNKNELIDILEIFIVQDGKIINQKEKIIEYLSKELEENY